MLAQVDSTMFAGDDGGTLPLNVYALETTNPGGCSAG